MRHPAAAACAALALALSACGGDRDEPPRDHPFLRKGPVTIESVFGAPSPLMAAAAKGAGKGATAAASPEAELPPATAEHPELSIEDEQGRRRTAFELHAVRGKGFPELKAVVRARRIGDTAAAAPVWPSCKAADRCEYRLGRTYTLTLSKTSTLQLVPRGEAVALVARPLSVPAPDATEVRLTGDAGVLARASVVLLAAQP